MLRLTAKLSSHISFAPNDKLVLAGVNTPPCGFETVDMAEFRAML